MLNPFWHYNFLCPQHTTMINISNVSCLFLQPDSYIPVMKKTQTCIIIPQCTAVYFVRNIRVKPSNVQSDCCANKKTC